MKQGWLNILKRSSPRQPYQLQTDKGKEFYNMHVQDLFRRKGIRHFSTSGDSKGAIIERFHRTMKGRMYRYFTAANTLKYIDILQDLVDGYNASYHRSIKMAPQDVTGRNEKEAWLNLYGQNQPKDSIPKFQEGDYVRLSKAVRPFKKGYLPQWTEEVFKVSRVNVSSYSPITYKVKELDDTPITGTFYTEELQKVHVDDNSIWRVDKILKRRGNQVKVHWKGWPAKYDSWIHRNDLVPV